MATRRSGFDKRERDRAKKARAAAKRERRQDRSTTDQIGEGGQAAPAGDQAAVLDQLAALHQDFEDGAVDFDTFEARKAELMIQLQVE